VILDILVVEQEHPIFGSNYQKEDGPMWYHYFGVKILTAFYNMNITFLYSKLEFYISLSLSNIYIQFYYV